MYRFGILFLLILIFSNLYSQDYEKGQLLVEFEKGTEIRTFVQKYAEYETGKTRLKVSEQLIPGMQYHVLEFDQNIDIERFLYLLSKDNSVKHIQKNHKVSLRSTVPNDPQFASQWQYQNTGQGGGVVGMDLDADLAWDISTGGLTAAGDTIVVAVIDDGASISHPDLAANIWLNHAEIPGNSIDDDGNGYTDDYLGWNSNTSDDNVHLNGAGGHGTPVCGIIGAVGNNNAGVSGVNWKVKIMLIRNNFNTNEANVLTAYGYALNHRKRYNESNGREGAFVVATNASWGVDNAFPAQAPIWCAFYDTLGKYGIINIASTTNNNVNVDAVGDLPTSCSSDYLISVSNLNRFGTRNGGYGNQSIDLGAFGDGVFTLSFTNYAGFGGTSAAAPHVSGAFALAYAAACGEFMSLSRIYPGQAALVMKNAILNGTVPNAGMNQSVSGGQLNLYNTLMEIQNNCPLDSCFAPFGLNLYSISDSNVLIDWAGGHDSTCLRLRFLGADSWLDSTVTDQFSIIFNNLSRCRDYELFVSGWCNGILGSSERIVFRTEGCCYPPDDIQQIGRTQFSAFIDWSANSDASGYQIRWREFGQSSWSFVNSSTDVYNFINLSPCSYYEMQIRTDCGDTLGGYGNSFYFYTEGCTSCALTLYCDMGGNNTDFDWIEAFRFGENYNRSGNNGGYLLYDSVIFQASAGENIPVMIQQGNDFQEAVRIWIDFNRDGDFNDWEEKVFEGMLNFTDSLNDFIQIPSHVSPGVTRMRVALQWSSYPFLCNQYQNGETEDYCIQIIPGTAIQNISAQSGPRLYPNPTDADFYIDDLEENSQIRIFDCSGRMIMHKENYHENSLKISLPENTASGLYFVEVFSEKNKKIFKIISD